MAELHRIPMTTEEVNVEWMSRILSCKISPSSFEVQKNAHEGMGYLSNLLRISCTSEDNKKFNLIVKLLPEEGMMRYLMLSEKMDQTEIGFYKIVQNDLVRILPQLKSYFCNFIYGDFVATPDDVTEYNSIIVLEDMKPKGYFVKNIAQDETWEEILTVVKFDAQLHFAGSTLEEEKGKPLTEIYSFLQGANLGEGSIFFEMGKQSFGAMAEFFEKLGADQELRNAYKQLEPFSEDIIKMIHKKSKEFPTLIHGDLWSNNLLFHSDPKMHTKVIDWQLLGYTDPTYDLATLIVTSLPMDILDIKHVNELLKVYYDKFTELNEAHGSKLTLRSWEDFTTFFHTYGMSYAYLWCSMAIEPFSLNFKRALKIFEFLYKDENIPQFLLSTLKENEYL